MTAKTEKMHTPAGDLKKGEVAEAKLEGAKEAIKEGAKAAMAADTGTTGDAEASAERANLQLAPDLPTTFIAPLLDLAADELTRRLKDEKAPDFISFEVAKGLLALERAGRNRTGYVKALCAAIGVKSPLEVTTAGPSYTNDESSVSAL